MDLAGETWPERKRGKKSGLGTTVDHATPVSAMDGSSAPDSNKEEPWHLWRTTYQILLISSPFIPNLSASYELLI